MKILEIQNTCINIDHIISFKVIEKPKAVMNKDDWQSSIYITLQLEGQFTFHVSEDVSQAKDKMIWLLSYELMHHNYRCWEDYDWNERTKYQ